MFLTSIDILFEGKKYSTTESWIPKFISLLSEYTKSVYSDDNLNRLSGELLRDIENNLYSGLTFYGSPVAPLKESTIKRKGHSRVFYDSGVLFQSVTRQPITSGYEVFIKDIRARIGSYLQYGNDNMEDRPFFGTTPERAEDLINKYYGN